MHAFGIFERSETDGVTNVNVWLRTFTSPIVREVVAAELPSMLSERRRACEQLAARNEPCLTEGEVAWGLLDAPAYLELFERSLERDIMPRLLGLGLAAAQAGSAAPSG